MISPIITALMTTFNSSDYVCQAIDSVLSQTYQNFQLLIVDDASTDSTCQLIENYSDPRIRLIRQSKNLGVGATLNYALQFIESEYVAKIDADDLCMPQRFEKQLAYLEANPELSFVKSYFTYFTDDEQVVSSERFHYFKTVKEPEHNAIDTPKHIAEVLMRWNCVIHSTYFARASVVKKLGYLPYRVGEDYSLFYRAIKAGHHIGCISEHLLKMRVSNTSVTTGNQAALHYSEALLDLKADRIQAILSQHRKLYVYGTGGLARAVAYKLLQRGMPFAGFVSTHPAESIEVNRHHWPVAGLDVKSKGLIVAAQPVRQQMLLTLVQQGWEEWQDFMVIA